MATQHVSVLANEVLEWLQPKPGQRFVDGTLGGGGHTKLIAEAVGNSGRVLALDADAGAIKRSRLLLESLPVEFAHSNFVDLAEVMAEKEWEPVDGILLDIGLSSDQLADTDRGFSFMEDGPLDLRFDVSQGETASELLQRLSEKDLADLIYRYGEERASRRIARRVVDQRGSIQEWSSHQLSELVLGVVPRSKKNPIHPATRTFQALRIAVNRELEVLELVLRDFPNLLKPGGRLAVISFHSLEDRIVKHAFREDERWEVLTRKPVRPTEVETQENPRARSSRMRVAARAAAVTNSARSIPLAPRRSDLMG